MGRDFTHALARSPAIPPRMSEDPNADPLNHLFFRATMVLLVFLAIVTFAWCIAAERSRTQELAHQSAGTPQTSRGK